MENYQQFYYSLFNRISDLISKLEQNELSQETIIQNLRQIQLDAEEDFITEPEHHEVTLTECILKEQLILNSGVMSLLMDSKKYQNAPASKLLDELQRLMTESGQYTAQFIQDHPECVFCAR